MASSESNKCCLLLPDSILQGAPITWLPKRTTREKQLGNSPKGPVLDNGSRSDGVRGDIPLVHIADYSTPHRQLFGRGTIPEHRLRGTYDIFDRNKKNAAWQCCWMTNGSARNEDSKEEKTATQLSFFRYSTSSLTTEEEEEDEKNDGSGLLVRNASNPGSSDGRGDVDQQQQVDAPGWDDEEGIKNNSTSKVSSFLPVSRQCLIDYSSLIACIKPSVKTQKDKDMDFSLCYSRIPSTTLCSARTTGGGSLPSTPASHGKSNINRLSCDDRRRGIENIPASSDWCPLWDDDTLPPPHDRKFPSSTPPDSDAAFLLQREGKSMKQVQERLSSASVALPVNSSSNHSNDTSVFQEVRQISACRDLLVWSERERDNAHATSTATIKTNTTRLHAVDKPHSPTAVSTVTASSFATTPPIENGKTIERTNCSATNSAASIQQRRHDKQRQHVRKQLLRQQQPLTRWRLVAAVALHQDETSGDDDHAAEHHDRSEQEVGLLDKVHHHQRHRDLVTRRPKFISFADEVPGNRLETVHTLPWEDRETRRGPRSASPGRARRRTHECIERFEL